VARVKLENVCKRFGNVEVVQKSNLEAKDQEFLVLVGPSGCGKTTTLRMIAGLEEVSEGKILIDENDVTNVHPKDRDISMVFQNYALYPHMTVKENMAFGLKVRKRPAHVIEERVKEASEILGLEKFLDRKPKQLSGGQRQRVALGRAIVRQPKVFLMDEPLSNLDAKLRVQTRGELKKLHKRLKATIIYVTHDQVEAMTLGDRIVIMDQGVIQQVEAPVKIYDKPANMFVGGFIGSPAMNFFDGIIEKKGANFFFDMGIAKLQLPSDLHKELDKYRGLETTIGVRPENIVDFEKAKRKKISEQMINAKLDFAERLGATTLIHATIGDSQFVGEVDPYYELELGQKLELGFDLSKMNLFDTKTKAVLI
jgi:multiple sugar transport system ATP-binding protein